MFHWLNFFMLYLITYIICVLILSAILDVAPAGTDKEKDAQGDKAEEDDL